MASISFHTATTGVIEHQKAIDILANNISNVNTYGYKAGTQSFQDLLYTNVDSTIEDNVTVGHGAKVAKSDTNFTEGVLTQTERDLDFAFEHEDGFFRIELINGETVYTRNGNFDLHQTGDGFLLVSGALNGYVTDASGNQIMLSGLNDEAVKTLDTVIGKFTFANLDGLVRNANGSFSETVASGAAYHDSTIGLKQAYLEASNTDYAEQITDVIRAQRAFQMNARMVAISDEIVDTINNLK